MKIEKREKKFTKFVETFTDDADYMSALVICLARKNHYLLNIEEVIFSNFGRVIYLKGKFPRRKCENGSNFRRLANLYRLNSSTIG